MKNKKLITAAYSICAILVFAALAFTAACVPPEEEEEELPEVIELIVANYQPPAFHTNTDILEPWGAMIEERTGGKVEFTYYTGGSLLPAADAYDGVVGGIADISHGYTGHTPGRFSLTEVMALPYLGITDSAQAGRIIYALYEEFPEIRSEFDDVHLLWLALHEPFVIHTTTPVRSLDDLAGMKIRVPSAFSHYITALGAIPVAMPGSETYMALKTGLIDGNMGEWTHLITYKEYEIAHYTTMVPLIAGVFFVAMNKDTYNGLPSDVREVIDELSGEWGFEFANEAWDRVEKELFEQVKEMPEHEIIYLSEEELEKFHDRCVPIWDEWIEDREAEGLPGREILDETVRLIEEE